MSRGISKDQKVGPKGSPQTTKNHHYSGAERQKAKKVPSKVG